MIPDAIKKHFHVVEGAELDVNGIRSQRIDLFFDDELLVGIVIVFDTVRRSFSFSNPVPGDVDLSLDIAEIHLPYISACADRLEQDHELR